MVRYVLSLLTLSSCLFYLSHTTKAEDEFSNAFSMLSNRFNSYSNYVNGNAGHNTEEDYSDHESNSIVNKIELSYEEEEAPAKDRIQEVEEENKVKVNTTTKVTTTRASITPRTTTMPPEYYKTAINPHLNGHGVNAGGRFLGVGPVSRIDAMEIEINVRTDDLTRNNQPEPQSSTTTTTTTSPESINMTFPFFDYRHVELVDKGSGFHPTLGTTKVPPVNPANEHSNFVENVEFVGDKNDTEFENEKYQNFDENTRKQTIKVCPSDYILHGNKCEKLCGYPVFSDQNKCSMLRPDQTLRECSNSSHVGLVVFAFVVLALLILFGNTLVPLLIWRNKELRSRHNFIKVSLAFADMVIGFILVCSVIPSIYSLLDTTNVDLMERLFHSGNSPGSIVGGSFLTLSAQASIMHLLFLSVERLIAIKWPLWHRTRKTSTLFLTIGVVWIWCLMVSLVPAMLSNEFQYSFSHVLFTPVMTPRPGKKAFDVYGVAYAFVTILLPYILTTVCILTTGVTVYRKIKVSNHMQAQSVLGHSRKRRQKNGEHMSGTDIVNRMRMRQKLKPDVVVFKTTIVMIVAFTLTILPFAVVVVMFLAGLLNCDNYTIPYTVCFMASMSNSFVNVLIYSIRDRNFRKAFLKTFGLQKANYADMWRTVTRKISNNTSNGTASTYISEHNERQTG